MEKRRIISQQEFDEAYSEHQLWLESEEQQGKQLSFPQTYFKDVIFPEQANLSGANLSGADLRGANLAEANLARAYLREANLVEADLVEADLARADLAGANLREADLSGANLRGANLARANLGGANLARAILARAYLAGADLREANLSGANLSGANLREANLSGANLREANLARADLYGADLREAKGLATKDTERIRNEYQEKIDTLQRERLELLTSTGNKNTELDNNKEQIKRLEAELEEKSQSKKALARIDDIFESLDKVKKDINNEQTRLNRMFTGYYIVGICCALFLVFVWIRLFCILDTEADMELIKFWINISPSVLLVTAIILCVNQAHKCQRQLLSIRELLYKHELIKSNMKSIIEINGEENVSKTISRVGDIFEKWAYRLMESGDNLEHLEQLKLNIDEKEKTTNDKAMDIIKALIGKL